MARQLIVDYLPFEVTKEQVNESLKTNEGRLVVRGVLQRAEVKNQNGRIYPRKILVREATKYLKEKRYRMVKLYKQLPNNLESLQTIQCTLTPTPPDKK